MSDFILTHLPFCWISKSWANYLAGFIYDIEDGFGLLIYTSSDALAAKFSCRTNSGLSLQRR